MASSSAPTASSTFVAADYTTSADFQGWYLQTTPQPIICASTQTYYTSSTYADCYDPSYPAPMPTGCDGATLLAGDEPGVCATSFTCASYKIFPTEGSDESQAVLRYGCMMNWAADSLYRTLPARYASSTAAPAKTETASDSASATATKHHHTATNTSTGSHSTSTSTSTSSSSGSSSGLSGGAIAGIAVGCVAAVAVLLLLLFRRKIMALFGKGKPASDNGPAWSPVYMPPETQSMSQATSNWQASEMSSNQEPKMVHEIGSSQANRSQAVHELG